MKKFLLLLTLSFCISSFAQQRIDSSFSFQTDPAKKFSIYIPSSYSTSTPNNLMLGLHPWNTSRWDAQSWCDTLIDFAEVNNLILICPDGGADGQVDDDIDTAFTTAILDSMENWYNINTNKVYAMGFSWGGKTTYTYGLQNHSRFGGFIPIGAAINGAGEISSVAQNAANEAFYLVHGSLDAIGTRYTPLLNSLNANNAIVESNLLQNVGHTIDFTNRNAILSRAYFWVDSVNCAQLSSISIDEFNSPEVSIYPNPIAAGEELNIQFPEIIDPSYQLSIVGLDGKLIWESRIEVQGNKRDISIRLPEITNGNYILILEGSNSKEFKSSISIK